MSLANSALLNSLGLVGFWVTDDDIFLPNITIQAGAYPIKGETSRVTVASAGSSMLLKSVLSGDAAPMTYVINDSGQAISVFPAVGEQNNGGTNTSLSIPAGQSGVFVRVPNNLAGSSSGWRSAVIP
jgi:hypothetical protein